MRMTKSLFGTDGVRGKANTYPMTPELAMKIGQAAGLIFTKGTHKHRVVIGKDTRLSGYMIESALVAGFTSVGMNVLLLGPTPTPAVAMLTRSLRADIGVMISASHNPYYDNGIKIFGPEGYKLSDEVEDEISKLVEGDMSRKLVQGKLIGRAKRIDDAQARYIEFAKRTLPRALSLAGLRVVIDCGNGAGYKVAPDALWELGAEVFKIGTEPDGTNINEGCGSTAPQKLAEKVKELRADIGIALDGDADRVIIVDEQGEVVNGDQLMAVVGASWQRAGRLSAPGIVSTVMSNLGLERYLQSLDLTLARTAVGDRYVSEYMRSHGYNVGGEQSGHLILSDYSTTGDGLVSALQILAVVVESGKPVSEVCACFEPVPQLLKNVRYKGNSPLDQDAVQKAMQQVTQKLGNSGRLVVRPSGTEPLIRVMAEGDDPQMVEDVVNSLCELIEKAI